MEQEDRASEWPVPLVHLRSLPEEPFDVIFDMETNDPDDYLTLYHSPPS